MFECPDARAAALCCCVHDLALRCKPPRGRPTVPTVQGIELANVLVSATCFVRGLQFALAGDNLMPEAMDRCSGTLCRLHKEQRNAARTLSNSRSLRLRFGCAETRTEASADAAAGDRGRHAD